ncbi:unnamed protein product [Protopolystoma xenopodis]|uniref:Uncharacterized protein n=1 Tax=Protopolystoma xenopodis TaxID=117903 RepID=A0A3S5AHU5_9PLAT|nr:unnamed protein product [Protopolystoma xenopodis]
MSTQIEEMQHLGTEGHENNGIASRKTISFFNQRGVMVGGKHANKNLWLAFRLQGGGRENRSCSRTRSLRVKVV